MSARTRLVAYTVIAGALATLTILGVITPEQQGALLAVAGSVLALVTAILMAVAARNVTPDSWSTIRHGVYVAASAVFAALGLFGLATGIAAPTMSIITEVLNVLGVLLLGTAAAKVPAPTEPYDPKYDVEEEPTPGILADGAHGPEYTDDEA